MVPIVRTLSAAYQKAQPSVRAALFCFKLARGPCRADRHCPRVGLQLGRRSGTFKGCRHCALGSEQEVFFRQVFLALDQNAQLLVVLQIEGQG